MAVLHPCLHCWGGGHHDHTLLGSPWEHPSSCRLVLIRWLWDVMKLIVTLWETNSGLCKVFWAWYLLDMLEASCTTTTRWSFWETLWQRNYVEIISPPSVLRGEIFNFWLGCRRLSVQRRKAWQALSQNWKPSNPMVYHHLNHFIIFFSRDSFGGFWDKHLLDRQPVATKERAFRGTRRREGGSLRDMDGFEWIFPGNHGFPQ